MKKVLILTLALFVSLTGAAYAAVSWNGMTIAKIFSSGQEVTSVTPAVVIKGSTYVPASMLRQFGFVVTAKGTNITVTKPPEKSTGPLKTPLSMDQITMLHKHAVAMIYSLDGNGKAVTQGSGFVVTSKGLMLTAHHVVEQNGVYQDLKVVLDGNTYNVSKDQIIHKDAEKDIAAIKLPDDLYDYLPLADGALAKNSEVFALGYPKGNASVIDGEVSTWYKGATVFRMFVDEGTSGGALITPYGEVAGVIQTSSLDSKVAVARAIGGEQLKDVVK